MWQIQVFENSGDKSKLNSRRNYEHIEFGECFLLFFSESFVFPSPPKNLKIKIHKTVILPVLLYWCETWSRTLRDEYRLRIFENRVLRRIYGPKMEEVAGGWRRLHNEEPQCCF
jgi:hypothetical protein